jgi:threonine dehydrogenase-like Zn-dependent dehydrogenase
MELTDGMGADKVFECVGGRASSALIPQSIEMVRRKGQVALIGALRPDMELNLDWRKFQWGEIDLIPVSGFYHWENDPEFKIVTDLLIEGKLHATEMITHRYPLDQINEAFETAANKKETNSIKVVIEP